MICYGGRILYFMDHCIMLRKTFIFSLISACSLNSIQASTIESSDLSYSFGVKFSEQIKASKENLDIVSFSEGFSSKHNGQESKLSSEQLSYAMGFQYGDLFNQENIDIDISKFVLGLTDAYQEKDLKISEESIQENIDQYMAKIQQQQEQAKEQMMQEMAENNMKEGSEYLSKNKQDPQVKVTDSGLQYKVINQAESKNKPLSTDTVKVHYTGRLINGTVFDSSVERGEPATFALQGVIPGWIEALQLMSPGDKWEVSIPSELAYAEFASPIIGPNKTLIFEIELLEINPETTES